jgi:hypothetical protein
VISLTAGKVSAYANAFQFSYVTISHFKEIKCMMNVTQLPVSWPETLSTLVCFNALFSSCLKAVADSPSTLGNKNNSFFNILLL